MTLTDLSAQIGARITYRPGTAVKDPVTGVWFRQDDNEFWYGAYPLAWATTWGNRFEIDDDLFQHHDPPAEAFRRALAAGPDLDDPASLGCLMQDIAEALTRKRGEPCDLGDVMVALRQRDVSLRMVSDPRAAALPWPSIVALVWLDLHPQPAASGPKSNTAPGGNRGGVEG